MGWILMILGALLLFCTFGKPSDMKTEAAAASHERFLRHKWRWRGVAALLIFVGLGLTPRSPSTQTQSTSTSTPPVAQGESQPATTQSRGIGRSYFQLTAFPGVVFVERTSDTLVDGRARRLLMTPDKLAVFEVIGPPDDPASASLSLFIPNDNDALVLRNAGLAQLFLANVAPAWVDRNMWLTSALDRAVGSPDASQQITRDGNTITVRYLQPLSTVSISVSPAP